MNDAAELIGQVAVLLTGGAVIGLALFVLWLYRQANQQEAQRGHRIPGALPYHVGLISISHLLLIATTMTRTLVYGIWPGSLIALSAYAMSAAALITMLRHQQSRIHVVLKQHLRKPRNERRPTA